MAVETISLDKVESNPYRDLVGHPIRPEQLEVLRASMQSTGFWEGLLVRPHPKKRGYYQLAFGHARIEAARTADKPVKKADFIVRDFDDDQMIRAMADENVTQFGRDEYATYREAVTAAVEQIMTEVIAGEVPKIFSEPPGQGTRNDLPNSIRTGDAPGIDIISRYFMGSLEVGPIRMALKEYRDSGKLTAWHAKHNPKATKLATKPTVDSEALGKFRAVHHVNAFAAACEEVGLPPEKQARIADHVLKVLKDPLPKPGVANTAKARKKSVDYQRSEKPLDERLTARNIRRVVTDAISKETRSPKEKARLEAQAHAISIESALNEMAIGLGRAAKAAGNLVGVARAIGGMKVDMTPTASVRLGQCLRDYRAIAESLQAAYEAGPNFKLKRIAA